jgi:hypothetical protein
MGKYRGYVVAKKGPKGRTAMRDSGSKTFKTKDKGKTDTGGFGGLDTLQNELGKANAFAKKNLYPPGSY